MEENNADADASHVSPQKEEVKREPLKSQNDSDRRTTTDNNGNNNDGSPGLLKINCPQEPVCINPCDIDVNSNVYGEPDKNVKTPKSENPSDKRKSQNRKSKNTNQKPFIPIKKNRYIAPLKKTPKPLAIDDVCNCTADTRDPCSLRASCINRLTYVECDPNTCLAADRCQNQRIGRKQPPRVEVRSVAERGQGLVTLRDLAKDQFVIEYVGEVINDAECKRRFKQMKKRKESNFYFLKLDKGMYIDAKLKGNRTRFINHSCEPNCEAQKWVVKKRSVIGIFAQREINKEEELTFDYVWKDFGLSTPCLCGTEKCSGKVGKK